MQHAQKHCKEQVVLRK